MTDQPPDQTDQPPDPLPPPPCSRCGCLPPDDAGWSLALGDGEEVPMQAVTDAPGWILDDAGLAVCPDCMTRQERYDDHDGLIQTERVIDDAYEQETGRPAPMPARYDVDEEGDA